MEQQPSLLSTTEIVPYRDTRTSVTYHWVHLPNSGALELLRWLEIAQMVGVDLYAPYQKGGMSLLRDVLRQINNPPGPDYLTLRLKFIV